jgi:hypothetical protein
MDPYSTSNKDCDATGQRQLTMPPSGLKLQRKEVLRLFALAVRAYSFGSYTLLNVDFEGYSSKLVGKFLFIKVRELQEG